MLTLSSLSNWWYICPFSLSNVAFIDIWPLRPINLDISDSVLGLLHLQTLWHCSCYLSWSVLYRPPRISSSIIHASGINERYVRYTFSFRASAWRPEIMSLVTWSDQLFGPDSECFVLYFSLCNHFLFPCCRCSACVCNQYCGVYFCRICCSLSLLLVLRLTAYCSA